MPKTTPDILENDILRRWPEVLRALLKDQTTKRNIFWATDMYEKEYGESYAFRHQITVEQITGDNGTIIRPRAVKSIEEQRYRIKDKAEVFTPSWICNAQNNLVDDAWFGRENVFNTLDEKTHEWVPTEGKIEFPENRTWQEYVCSNRLEITCGEAPYLVSRYDTTTGKPFAELNLENEAALPIFSKLFNPVASSNSSKYADPPISFKFSKLFTDLKYLKFALPIIISKLFKQFKTSNFCTLQLPIIIFKFSGLRHK